MKDNNQPAPISQNSEPSTQTPMSAKPANVSDMFGDVDPVAGGDNSVNKPSAVQSGKIKPVSQTSTPNMLDTSTQAPTPTMQVPKETTMPNVPSTDTMMITDTRSSGVMRKIIVAVLVIFLLFVVGGGIYYFFFMNKGDIINSNENTNTVTNQVTDENINEANNEDVEDVVMDDSILDDDFDGLNNALEKTYGTNPLEADSDNDGVFDQDEVETYHTDPLVDDSDSDGLTDYEEIFLYKTDPNDPDTDGDKFLDGVEVANGYNPLGNGKLEETPVDNNLNTNEGL